MDILQPITTIAIAIIGAISTSVIIITKLKTRVEMLEKEQLDYKEEINGFRNDFKEYCKETTDRMADVAKNLAVLAKEFSIFSERFKEN